MDTLPDSETQRRTTSLAGEDAMREARAFAAQCRARFRRSPLWGTPDARLLDFGTGWGRIARCFVGDFPAERIIGLDVDPDLIGLARDTVPGAVFVRCDPFPPAPLADASIHFVVAYSVLSHLSEAAALAWVREFARLLRPGGRAALTTRGRWFFDYARTIGGAEPYHEALRTMFADFGEARARYDRGELVHSNAQGVTGGGVLTGAFYGETFIPEAYARRVYDPILRVREFAEEAGTQPIMFLEAR